ncbi:hypothetical protein LY625_10490 [Lysobacter sp. GX 14042]|uniref:hypothetical protein n=1 Tax=Lysobacter sp. GX 14042 TaxID=2907155 RepID=UPI001F2C7365|nr:hypothetical protein [Lysobacter sp. GX 14042]MCE7033035.1 hypothetical protein [Lysobacter sp. GX 14042]
MNDPREQDHDAGGPGASDRKRAFDADGVREDEPTAERLLREAGRDTLGGGAIDTPDGERTETRDQLEGLGGSGIPAVDDVRSDVPDDELRENR